MSNDTKDEDQYQLTKNDLVDTAVEFLSNPKILNQPEHQKISFLKKKGLNEEQISAALMRVPISYESTSNQSKPAVPLQISSTPSTWGRLRDTTNTIICLSGLFFGCKYIYKYYIDPYLTGVHPKSERDIIIEVQESMMSVISQIQTTLDKMDTTLDLHRNAVKKSPSDESIEIELSRDIRTELKSIKGLLISRQTFPQPPIPSSSIPKWQSLQKQTQDESSVESSSFNNSPEIPQQLNENCGAVEEIAIQQSNEDNKVHTNDVMYVDCKQDDIPEQILTNSESRHDSSIECR